MSATRRGGIPGPESRTGLVRPAMTEAEFERRMSTLEAEVSAPADDPTSEAAATPAETDPEPETEPEPVSKPTSKSKSKGRSSSSSSSKSKRVQRMFAIEEEVDKKLWLYAIHVGKDRSEVVNDLLRPLVGSMGLYDSRDRKSSSRNGDAEADS